MLRIVLCSMTKLLLYLINDYYLSLSIRHLVSGQDSDNAILKLFEVLVNDHFFNIIFKYDSLL